MFPTNIAVVSMTWASRAGRLPSTEIELCLSFLPGKSHSRGRINAGSPTSFAGSFGAKSTWATQENERREEYIVQRKEQWILRTYTLSFLLRRIIGFRCYSGAADGQVHKESPKAWYQLNTDTPDHASRDYRELDVPFLTKSAVLQTLTLPFSPHFFLSHLLLSLLQSLFCQVAQRRKSPTSASAYWGKWTFEMTEGDGGLSAEEDASKLSEGPLGRWW